MQEDAARRPWTRWWWFGSAVDEAEIVRQLELFEAAGFGGVEISPIYAIPGSEARTVPFLSPRWIELLRFTVRQSRSRGLDVDLICGTGWPFGGPSVSAADAAQRVVCERFAITGGGDVAQEIGADGSVAALVAYAPDGRSVELGNYVDGQRMLRWAAPPGDWTLYALLALPTGQQVKRAAPGGVGHVVDHFGAAPIERYLAWLTDALATIPGDERPRCLFNDSYEVYEANWTGALLAEFERRRGYDLRRALPELYGAGDSERGRRVRADYRATVAELLLDNFAAPWTAWARGMGARARYQAHGSPGNLLDLYAAADVPETEAFGPDWLRLAGAAPLPGTPPEQGGRADIVISKLASSAAHVAGRPLCSSEMFTWLGEHGKVPLSHMKAELDVLFAAGINHVLFHGTPLSLADASWPGWLFYAATNVSPANPLWRDLPALNAYITRCQALLQAGEPANDLLVYFPISDLWSDDGASTGLLHFLSVHTRDWRDERLPEFSAAAHHLWDAGYSFDLVSDRMLEGLVDVEQGALRSRGGTHRALLVAGCAVMPPATLQRIAELAERGATVLFLDDLPSDVPGLADLAARRAALAEQRTRLRSLAAAEPRSAAEQGRVRVGAELGALLDAGGLRRERGADAGLTLLRRRAADAWLYFVANLSPRRVDQWVSLAVAAPAASIEDPLTGLVGRARSRPGADGSEVYLQLEPGESLLLRLPDTPSALPAWPYLERQGAASELSGRWQVEFIAGGPTLPQPAVVAELTSWTEWAADHAALAAFAGTARYTLTFDRPSPIGARWLLELGAVCHSARVTLNGVELGTLVAPPFQVRGALPLRETGNLLAIEVTNLMTNRLADLDRQGAEWRPFLFVDIEYQPFDAAGWAPLESGLLGPVRLVPLR